MSRARVDDGPAVTDELTSALEREKMKYKNGAIQRPIRLKGIMSFFFFVSCSLWPEPRWKRKFHAICFLRFYFENIWMRSVCVCVRVAIDFHFSILHPIVFSLHRLPASGRHRRFDDDVLFCCVSATIHVSMCFPFFSGANCEPFFAIVNGNGKRVVRFIQRLSQIGIANQRRLGAQSIMHISHFRTLFFPIFAASVRLSSFGNRRQA